MMFFNNSSEKSIIELLPFIQYDDNADCFQMKNGKYMDILHIKTKDLETASESEVEYDILHIAKYFKTFSNDNKIVSLNFPTDTKEQQQYIKHKIENCNNTIFKNALYNKLEELEYIEQHRTDREYYLIFYSDTPNQHIDDVNLCFKSLGAVNMIEKLDKRKKYQILFKMNNKNTSIFI